MAKPKYVWGIDIGQCALKALRCRKEGDEIVAEGFDYIEYPKILSQPEADPQALVAEAIELFLSRNEIKGDDIAMAVSGQSRLAKFFKPPPVDIKRIPDIVRYEAKQQIPFPLEEVIWDFQKMPGGQIVEGFAIDTEVGLFAMKRDQVYRAMKPFDKVDVELDFIQLAPLSIYNFVTHDLLTDLPDPDFFDPDDPPESIVVLSMGTDATDLVITNGFRVWQRSIPLGGNHFTKQLTKELKLTFAKAEHLKRNAGTAEDPKTVFQAMRPIFNDVVTEVQRSIGYFQGIDRNAKIRGVVLLGNTVKLPGLQQYIAKNLGYDVIEFNKFNRLNGSSVLSSPAFNENVLGYGVCYGLCLQGLGQAELKSNLLPREIMTRRMIRAKKPWAVASVGALMLAFAFNFVFNYSVWSEVQPDHATNNVSWDAAEGKVSSVSSTSSNYESQHADKVAQLEFLAGVGDEVVGAGDRRLLWLELLKAIDSALPWTPGTDPQVYTDFKTLPLDKRHELYIDYVESEYFPDLTTWYTDEVQKRYFELLRHLEETGQITRESEDASETDDAAAPAEETFAADDAALAGIFETAPVMEATPAASPSVDLGVGSPTGPGWVIEMKGHHFYNSDRRTGGATHLRNTLLKNLEAGKVTLPIDKDGTMATFTMKELGISFPILAIDEGQPRSVQVPNPDYDGPAAGAGMAGMMGGEYGGYGGYGAEMMGGPGMGGPGMGGAMPGAATKKKKDEEDESEEENPPTFTVSKYSFTVQFCWQEKLLSERLKERAEKAKLKAEAAAAAAAMQPADGGQDNGDLLLDTSDEAVNEGS